MIVGAWTGKRTIISYRADTIFSEFANEVVFTFMSDGSASVPFLFGISAKAEWYWLPDSSKLLLYTPTQNLLIADTSRITVLSSATEYRVTNCSGSELWFEDSSEATLDDPNDRYQRSFRLEKKP